MNKIFKSLREFFSPQSTDMVGLCSFEHLKESSKQIRVEQKQKKELRLSELME